MSVKWEDTSYEMIWDCRVCGTKDLLALTHKRCPACGSNQNPKDRRFPEEGHEVVAKGHIYVGADWVCEYCSSGNSAKAAFCGSCGAPKDKKNHGATQTMSESSISEWRKEHVIAKGLKNEIASDEKSVNKKNKLIIMIAALVLAPTLFLLYGFFKTESVNAVIHSGSWWREVAVERYSTLSSEDWCSSIPYDARVYNQYRAQRSTRTVVDGQSCHSVRKDNGDGTFSKGEECTDRTHEEPVYDTKCAYHVDRWVENRHERSDGGIGSVPFWPTPSLSSIQNGRIGSERLGKRSENYNVIFKSNEKTWDCDISKERWDNVNEGSKISIPIRMIGGAVCGEMVLTAASN